MKKLGIVGGLGPLASAYFYELLTKMTDAQKDQEHIELLLYSVPDTPDRTAFMLGESDVSPLVPIKNAIKVLENAGMEFVSMPCVTAHYFFDELQASTSLPIINMVDALCEHLQNQNIKSVGILATTGTIRSGFLQTKLSECGIKTIVPDVPMQNKVMETIYNIKADEPICLFDFSAVAESLSKSGAEKIILGCTELSIINKEHHLNETYIDALEVLAAKSLERCGVKCK